jgi:peroxin-7
MGEAVFRSEFQGFAVKWSPFQARRMAVATSQYFGIVGNGRLHVLDALSAAARPDAPALRVAEARSFYSQDGMFDCAWSECNAQQIVTACGDGSVRLWDLGAADGFPVRAWKEHAKECAGVDWNLVDKRTFATASWDGTTKVWDPNRTASIRTLAGHSHCVYAVAWSPHSASVLCTVSGDRTLRVWDARAPEASRRGGFDLGGSNPGGSDPGGSHPGGGAIAVADDHMHEVLCCDWAKYAPWTVATGSADREVREFDLRAPAPGLAARGPPPHARAPRARTRLRGHTLPVRRVRYDPHAPGTLASAGYDMSVRLWAPAREDALLARFDHHTEFVCGLDFSLGAPGLVATCSWDRSVCVWDARGPPPRPIPKAPMAPPGASGPARNGEAPP